MGGRRPAPSRPRALTEIAVVVGAAALALFLLPRHLGQHSSWLVPALLLYAPLGAVMLTDRDFRGCGLTMPSGRPGRDLAGFVLVVLPLFLAGYFAFALGWQGRGFSPVAPGAGSLLELAAWQLVGVALPEEVFFRGWLQGRLNRVFRSRFAVPGARVGPGLFVAAAFFAVFHLLDRSAPSRLVVFFPGLLFGLYRERTKSVAVPVLAHAAANLGFMVAQSWVN